ncbi:SDR family NAD(P)-dependent oxidoreductase [Herbaspirillum frisingense]|uniref:SDR family NAD(P)-dependent oxidoreductase n=1 Tax=Herbaspirillum frisingense TaxID=92645 RepID=UPI0016016344|nr:SDR family NAD(P)-dependent oxidoreductase [Herbaspirillum frisingense]QNB06738.1 SDR family NAD(P)-dependent oxidoreductase [Herbaspirillum frisingense]
MSHFPYQSALIIGAGAGISAALARQLAERKVRVGLVARDTTKLQALASDIAAFAYQADASQPEAIAAAFTAADKAIGVPDVVIYNPSARVRGSLLDLDPLEVEQAIKVTAFGGFLAVQQAARRMVPNGHGAIFLTGATASWKGYAHSAAFAMGKFALRALSQSAARELGPKGVHVAHFIVDGRVRSAPGQPAKGDDDHTLDPQAIAQTYISTLLQPRSAWSQEVDLRPWTESF